VDRLWVSGDFFATLGVRALLVCTITLADEVAGGGPEGPAVISLDCGNVPVTIVGVTPPDSSAWTQPLIESTTPLNADAPFLNIMLRLKPGQSLDAATAAETKAGPAPSKHSIVGTLLLVVGYLLPCHQ
jgi:hypothetical protein